MSSRSQQRREWYEENYQPDGEFVDAISFPNAVITIRGKRSRGKANFIPTWNFTPEQTKQLAKYIAQFGTSMHLAAEQVTKNFNIVYKTLEPLMDIEEPKKPGRYLPPAHSMAPRPGARLFNRNGRKTY